MEKTEDFSVEQIQRITAEGEYYCPGLLRLLSKLNTPCRQQIPNEQSGDEDDSISHNQSKDSCFSLQSDYWTCEESFNEPNHKNCAFIESTLPHMDKSTSSASFVSTMCVPLEQPNQVASPLHFCPTTTDQPCLSNDSSLASMTEIEETLQPSQSDDDSHVQLNQSDDSPILIPCASLEQPNQVASLSHFCPTTTDQPCLPNHSPHDSFNLRCVDIDRSYARTSKALEESIFGDDESDMQILEPRRRGSIEAPCKRRKFWSDEESLKLFKAVRKIGLKSKQCWIDIRDRYFSDGSRSNIQLKDRWRTITDQNLLKYFEELCKNEEQE